MKQKKTMATASEYIKSLAPEQAKAVQSIRSTIKKNLPKGFTEGIQYGMITYSVPFKIYPEGYHCDPAQPLPFIMLAQQKNSVNMYHMGIYADPALLSWFVKAYEKAVGKKPDMGKSCIRFKDPSKIPFDLIGALASKISPEDWVARYEKAFRR